jgi:hypothetical protein
MAKGNVSAEKMAWTLALALMATTVVKLDLTASWKAKVSDWKGHPWVPVPVESLPALAST